MAYKGPYAKLLKENFSMKIIKTQTKTFSDSLWTRSTTCVLVFNLFRKSIWFI